jgi:Peptidase family S41
MSVMRSDADIKSAWRRTLTLVRKEGMPQRARPWLEKYKGTKPPESLGDLNRRVSEYHSHSSVQDKAVWAARFGKRQIRRRLQRPPECVMGRGSMSGIATIRLFMHVIDPTEVDEAVRNGTPVNRLPTMFAHASIVHDFLDKHKHKIRGIIVDLRRHEGGSMWPGLYALGQLLEGHVLFAFANIEGPELLRSKDWMTIVKRKSGAHGPSAFSLQNCKSTMTCNTFKLDGMPVPVAVLIGPHTCSSGEFIAAALGAGGGHRDHVRSFGARTAGALTVNQSYDLVNGLSLWLTTHAVIGCGQLMAEDAIDPDVATSDPERAARAWIRGILRALK